ncbi:PREDICTED: uncharacterized protein LOC109164546 isoform X2 [Ipomoea nil]|uniref:uncharacterized protein LOC109164546 isoform X2 n=1 Tax=Ipomoea nil TaxID=35883 RepID=UPI000901AE44|nr:PREDICTED: uncharacterized protein LOC109164546 isoform X2 [Ipomoea nil]
MAATTRILRLRPNRRHDNFFLFSSFSSSDHHHSNVINLDEIRKKVTDSQRRLSHPPPPPSSPSLRSEHISFQELYKRNVDAPKPASSIGSKERFDAIKNSLRTLKEKNQGFSLGKTNDPLSFNKYTDSLRLRPGNLSPEEPPTVIGSDKLPTSIFGKEIKGLKDGKTMPNVGQVFVRNYTYQELGEKLRALSPEHKGKKNVFSLQELSDRLHKLRMNEEKESESRVGEAKKYLMDAFRSIKFNDEKSSRIQTIRNLDILGHLGENTDYLLHPPKENLVEKYFDPVNMSSAEKMKLELKKVRDQFKMSESDCGSARVQVAQLTTKIKHLSGVLHKKDKHSRKGLQAMVQKRKKLLKYLRRTDWDSYCLVLSSLGLRDNPDYKN